MRVTDTHVFFWSGVFSNWHPSPFVVDGVAYNCSEQYLMAGKARLFGDEEALRWIMGAADPADQKRYGRGVRGFVKEKWDAAARDIMYTALVAKFTSDHELREALMDTGDRLIVEASPQDRIWGIGLHWDDNRCLDPKNWRGTNWLGETLTRVRDDLRKGEQCPPR